VASDAGDSLFSPEETDFSELYKGGPAPTGPSPVDELYKKISGGDADAALAAKADPVGSTAQAPGTQSTTQPAAEEVALLERLKPHGITALSQLKSKTDVELRQIASDVMGRETRERALARFFFKNADGTFNYSMTPEGKPTGLTPEGERLPPPAPPAPPAAPAPPPAKKPPAKKPVATKPAPVKRRRKPIIKAAPARPVPAPRPLTPRIGAARPS
jgi:hypothetical protein